jgi:hypothetical protein
MKTDIQTEITLKPGQDSFVLLVMQKNEAGEIEGVLTLEGRIDKPNETLQELFATEATSAKTHKIL